MRKWKINFPAISGNWLQLNQYSAEYFCIRGFLERDFCVMFENFQV